MPRPKRTRRAPTQTAKSTIKAPAPADISDSDARPSPVQERGRRRTTRSTGARLSNADEQLVSAANQRRDATLDRLAKEDPTSASGNANEDTESGSSVEIGRRTMATPAHRRDTTGLDLADDSVFGALEDSFEDGEVPRGMQSTDTSSLSFSNFKRRPRQSSIIGRNDPPIRPSSRGGNTPSISATLNLGAFRRRRREPSILGTARKPLLDDTELGHGSASDSEEDFAPEAESTPLNNRRRTRPANESEDEEPKEQSSPEAANKAASRKRKSQDALPSSDRPEKVSRLDVNEEAEVVDSDSESELSSISSPLGPPPTLGNRPSTPVNDEDIAPPASSGSEDNNVIWPDIHTLAKRRRRPSITTPTRVDAHSDISSPPSLTHSPNFAESRAPKARERAATRRQPSPEVTTADLTSMLPKRRYKKARDPFGLESDEEYDTTGMGEDEDELSYLDSRSARRRKGSRPPSRATSARPTSRGGRTAHSALKPRQIPASAKGKGASAKTYSRRSSDKENEGEEGSEDEHDNSRFQPLPDDTFDRGNAGSDDGPSADELKQAAKKFKEVDQWELEFEEATEDSANQDAR